MLVKNGSQYKERVAQINDTALILAKWFESRPEIENVYYPGCGETKSCFDACKRDTPESGYGCLLSIIPREDVDHKRFFDALNVHKGPSLGTDYTLVCPYTLLAHYNELEWAATYGVDFRIIRISVGLGR